MSVDRSTCPNCSADSTDPRTKLFFFYNEEWYKQLTPQASANNIEVPTAQERKAISLSPSTAPASQSSFATPAIASAGTWVEWRCLSRAISMPKSCMSPGSAGGVSISSRCRTPPFGGNAYNYTSQISSKYPRREDIVRVDYLINQNNRLTGRYINNYDDQILVLRNHHAEL